MTGIDYFLGLAVLLLGFNIGFYEAGKGLRVEDFKRLLRNFRGKIKK